MSIQGWLGTWASWLFFALARLMRLIRQILVLATLALYTIPMVGGRLVCYWTHLAGNDVCCTEPQFGTAASWSQCHDSEDDRCQQQDGHSPGKKPQHDSSACGVCQFLGQAQESSTELGATLVLAVSPVVALVSPDFSPSPGHSDFQARAPPATWV